jgi:mannose-1-phosphate guanylyltransferase
VVPQASSLKPQAFQRSAVILAGGSGTRLWPLSRKRRPKQLIRLFDGRSLLQEAYQRLLAVVSPSHIYVIALAEHLPAIAEELPGLFSQNLIGEPVGRDTANAIALAAAILHAKNADTVMGVFTADHLIRPEDRFAEVIARGYAAVEQRPDALVTFGVKPSEPHTGMGYVQRGDAVAAGVWKVRAFREKPDLATARNYVSSGDYFWNSGMFVWRTATILDQLRLLLPESYAALQPLAAAWHTAQGPAMARTIYPTLKKISIDFAVMEKASNVLMVEMNLEWLDVGHWTSLPVVLGGDSKRNTTAAGRAAVLDGKNNILVSEDDHLIATIGVDDLVVVHSRDATLVCRRDQVDKIKDMVARLDKDFEGRYS